MRLYTLFSAQFLIFQLGELIASAGDGMLLHWRLSPQTHSLVSRRYDHHMGTDANTAGIDLRQRSKSRRNAEREGVLASALHVQVRQACARSRSMN